MIKGIFFDLYGTLFEFGNMDKAWEKWFLNLYKLFREYGLTLTQDEFEEKCSNLFSQDEPENMDSDLSVFANRLKRLSLEVNTEIPNIGLTEIADTVVSAWQEEVSLDPQVHEVLTDLKKRYRVCLISNFDHPSHVYKMLDRYNLNGYFEVITVSGDVGVKKPDAAIFNDAFIKTGLNPSEVYYVGDTKDDVEGAKNSGMIPILISRIGKGTKEKDMDFKSNIKTRSLTEQHPGLKVINRLSNLLN